MQLNKAKSAPATNQSAVLFSHNKSAPAISHSQTNTEPPLLDMDHDSTVACRVGLRTRQFLRRHHCITSWPWPLITCRSGSPKGLHANAPAADHSARDPPKPNVLRRARSRLDPPLCTAPAAGASHLTKAQSSPVLGHAHAWPSNCHARQCVQADRSTPIWMPRRCVGKRGNSDRRGEATCPGHASTEQDLTC